MVVLYRVSSFCVHDYVVLHTTAVLIMPAVLMQKSSQYASGNRPHIREATSAVSVSYKLLCVKPCLPKQLEKAPVVHYVHSTVLVGWMLYVHLSALKPMKLPSHAADDDSCDLVSLLLLSFNVLSLCHERCHVVKSCPRWLLC